MSPFVNPSNCDAAALEALVDESILIKSSGGFAPAHDVIEDWAVAHFIAQAFNDDERNPLQLFAAVGTEPAMRRGFRLWLADALASSDKERVMDFVVAVFQHTDMPPLWHDEIAVSVLQSDSAGAFIERTTYLLLKNGKVIYKRLIHVLRTACKGPNDVFLNSYGLAQYRNLDALGAIFVVPIGSGWRELILFTYRHSEAFAIQDAGIVLELLNDWSQGNFASGPLPPEAAAAAQLCLKYWRLLLEQDFLKLLFKFPHAAPREVEELIHAALAGKLPQHNASNILEQVTKSFECHSLCQHLPELVIDVAEKTWCLPPDSEGRYLPHTEIETCFGLVRSMHEFFPQSSLQGPFILLLGSHTDLAIDFIVRITNHAAVSYSRSQLSDEVGTLHLPTTDGSRPLIGSRRLYHLYRGLSTGPMVLECALRSLDAWLLAQAKQNQDIRGAFDRILKNSTSVATLAVLASVATAYPAAVGEQALPLLCVREFYQWDFERSHQEDMHITDARISLGLPSGGIEEIYYSERKDSSALPHRKNTLEYLAFRLQLPPLCDEVWAIIDQFHAELPPIAQQTQSDKLWRAALHRMDVRNVTFEENAESGQIVVKQNEAPSDLQQNFAEHKKNTNKNSDRCD